MMRALLSFAFFVGLAGCASTQTSVSGQQSSVVLFDAERQRSIPIELYFPERAYRCTSERVCPVAIISAGYGIGHKSYSFIASALGDLGYLTVAVQHELPSDPPLATQGDLFVGRTPNWQRGAQNLRFAHNAMRRAHPSFNWDSPILIGHSNGGDISAWLIRESPTFAGSLVTLDSRRVPLPRAHSPGVLSIRASDFQADAGVLPTDEERKSNGTCVLKIIGARHNDMHDGGPADLKSAIARYVVDFLDAGTCKMGA